jgi:hypothetical protein
MEVIVGNPLLRSGLFPTLDVRGQEYLVVVTKGTLNRPGFSGGCFR